MTEYYLGTDPGLSGGFAVVSGDEIKYKMVMPTISFTTKQGKTKTEIDRQGVLSFLKIFPPHVHAVIEQQEAFRSQNITATCTTCRNYGILLMALTVARFYVTEVPSSTWQEYYGIVSAKKGKGETTKQQAYRIAQAKYLHADFRKSGRAQKPHDGIVDATLIAGYCQSLFAPLRGAVTGVQYISRRDETPLELKNIYMPGREGLHPLAQGIDEMLGINHRCKFYKDCYFADATSRTCTQDGGGDYCGVYRVMTYIEKEKEKETKR